MSQPLTADEIRKLPPEQRDAILEAQAALAEHEYRDNPDLTDFEAYCEENLHGESSSSESR